MAHPDLDELLNALLPFAQEMLSKHGEFHPFGAAMKHDGTVTAVAGDVGKDQPTADEVIDLLIDGFRRQADANEIKASGICMDVRSVPPGQTDKSDAICARLEHRSGEAVEVFLPYRQSWLGKPKFGEIYAGQGKIRVFRGE